MVSEGRKAPVMRMNKKDNQATMKVINRVENRAPPRNIPPISTPPSILDCYVFKTLLEQYFQKEGIRQLVYETINEGTEHEPFFRSTVIINNVRYDSLPGFLEPLDAEHSAAEVALIVLANSPDTRSRLSQIMLTSGVGKNRLELYCRKMNYAPPKYECYGEPGNFCSFVTVGDIKYAGSSESTEKEANVSACRTALTTIEAAARASEDNIRNSIFTVVPKRNKVSDPGYSAQSKQGPINPYCSSQVTTAETTESERISTKMDCSFQDTAMVKYPLKDGLSQNTTVAALEPKKGLVEIGCSSIGTTVKALEPKEDLVATNGRPKCIIDTGLGIKMDGQAAEVGRISQEKAFVSSSDVNIEDNKSAIDSGMGVSISTQENDVPMLSKTQRRRMTRFRSKARKEGAVSDNNFEIGKVRQTGVVGVDPKLKPNNRQGRTPSRKTDFFTPGTASSENNYLKLGSSENVQASIFTAANSSFRAQQTVREPERKKYHVKTDYLSQGATNTGFEVKMDCSSQGTTVKALEQKEDLVESDCLSKGTTNAKAAKVGLINNQEKTLCGSLEVNIEDNNGVIKSDAAIKLSKGQIKRMRQKRNRALRKEGALPVVNVNGQAALESTTTEPVVYQMANNLEICKARQTGVIGTDAVQKPNARKRKKRTPSNFNGQGISAKQIVNELEPQKDPIRTECVSQSATNAGFEVKFHGSSQGTMVDINCLSKDRIDSDLINQEKVVCGSSNVNTIDNNAAIDGTNENDAALKPSKCGSRKLRLKKNRAPRNQQVDVKDNQSRWF